MLSTAPEYERKSMINEIVRRMCSKKASTDHLIADPPPPLLPAAAAVMPAVAASLAVDPLAALKAVVAASADPRASAQGLLDLGMVSAAQHAEIVREVVAGDGGGAAASKS